MVPSVPCKDLYAKEIEAEKDLPFADRFWENEFYAKTEQHTWFCPNTTVIVVNNGHQFGKYESYTDLHWKIMPCSNDQKDNAARGMTSWFD